MLKKILIILMILIFAVGVVSAQDVNNETGVDLELNDDSALAETSNNFTTLQENIDATPDNGEIEIEGTYKNNDRTTISIYKNITITGKENGATLDGNNLSATMIVIGQNANVHLKNLIFTNANGSNVIQSYGTVYLDNCTFINNRALSSVVYLDNGVNTISKCYFSDNQLITSLINAKGQLTISNSTFINAPNDEDNYYDVFMFNAMNALVENTKLYYAPMTLQNSNVTFDNCYLKKCERYEQGRFITDYILSLNCASIHNCTIEATVATIGNHTFKNNRLIGNTHISSYANDTYIEECEFENSTLTINDGGVNNCIFKNSDKAIICPAGRNITINNCSFTNISSIAISVVPVYDYENVLAIDALRVNECNFTNFNRAIRCKSIFASLNDCSFTDGKDTVIDFILKDDGIVDNCKFENVTSRDSIIKWTGLTFYEEVDGFNNDYSYSISGRLANSRFINIKSNGWGTVETSINNFNMKNCSFINVINTNTGFGINHGHTTDNQSLNISDSEFIGCIGSVRINSNNNKITRTSFINCAETIIEIGGLDTVIANCTFINNTCRKTSVCVDIFGEENTGIFNSTFINNSATYGGAVYFRCAGKIDNCTFIGNNGEEGGAIYVYASYGVPTIANCTFANNTSKHEGDIYGYYYFTAEQIGEYFGEATLKVTLYDKYTNQVVPFMEFDASCTDGSNAYVNQKDIYNTKFKTSKDGTATVALPLKVGTRNILLSVDWIDNFFKVTIKKNSATLSAPAAKIAYDSGKYFQAKIISSSTKKALANVKITIKVFTGTKSKEYSAYTDKNGIAKFSLSKLSTGEHKVTVSADSNTNAKKITTKLTIKKANTITKAPKVTNKYKKSKYFKVTVKHKDTKKAIKKIVVKLKIGKKTYKVKTDKNGVAKYNTKGLKVGKHKVVISSGDSKYQISAKSQITIKR